LGERIGRIGRIAKIVRIGEWGIGNRERGKEGKRETGRELYDIVIWRIVRRSCL
jgi:hypothetical protein